MYVVEIFEMESDKLLEIVEADTYEQACAICRMIHTKRLKEYENSYAVIVCIGDLI